MNSTGNVLTGFTWEYDGTVGFARGKGYKGDGISRTIFLHPNIADVPEQLFAVKVSQSTNQAKAGKYVFKYLTYAMNAESKMSDLAPNGVDMTTPLAEIKNMFLQRASEPAFAEMKVSLNISLKGKFTSIACSDDTYKLYDEDEPAFKTDDPDTTGNAPYYIKNDAQIHVKLKGAMSKQGNEYIQTTLSTTSTAAEVLAKVQRGAIWNPEGNSAAASAPAAAAAANQNSVW